jgi:hypothetical protein
MTEDEFWDHIRASRHADPDAHAERLTARLVKLPEEGILDFVHLWDTVGCRAHRRDLWGAAYLINGGCSDDGFHYFCEWLILQGRVVYEAAIADPDSLADVLDGEREVEHECNPGMEAWFTRTGTTFGDAGLDAYERAMKFRQPKWPPRLPPLARRWDFDDDDELRKRFPRLAAMYLGDDDNG